MTDAPFGTEVIWIVELKSSFEAHHEITISFHNLETALSKPLSRNPSIQLPRGPINRWRTEIVEYPNIKFPDLWGYDHRTNSYVIALDFIFQQVGNVDTFHLKQSFNQSGAIQPFLSGGIYRLDCKTSPSLHPTSASLFIKPPDLNYIEKILLWVTAKARKKDDVIEIFYISWNNPGIPISVSKIDSKKARFSATQIDPNGILIYQKLTPIGIVPFLFSLIVGIVIGILGNWAYDYLLSK
jgi:hypothetical protein